MLLKNFPQKQNPYFQIKFFSHFLRMLFDLSKPFMLMVVTLKLHYTRKNPRVISNRHDLRFSSNKPSRHLMIFLSTHRRNQPPTLPSLNSYSLLAKTLASSQFVVFHRLVLLLAPSSIRWLLQCSSVLHRRFVLFTLFSF